MKTGSNVTKILGDLILRKFGHQYENWVKYAKILGDLFILRNLITYLF